MEYKNVSKHSRIIIQRRTPYAPTTKAIVVRPIVKKKVTFSDVNIPPHVVSLSLNDRSSPRVVNSNNSPTIIATRQEDDITALERSSTLTRSRSTMRNNKKRTSSSKMNTSRSPRHRVLTASIPIRHKQVLCTTSKKAITKQVDGTSFCTGSTSASSLLAPMVVEQPLDTRTGNASRSITSTTSYCEKQRQLSELKEDLMTICKKFSSSRSLLSSTTNGGLISSLTQCDDDIITMPSDVDTIIEKKSEEDSDVVGPQSTLQCDVADPSSRRPSNNTNGAKNKKFQNFFSKLLFSPYNAMACAKPLFEVNNKSSNSSSNAHKRNNRRRKEQVLLLKYYTKQKKLEKLKPAFTIVDKRNSANNSSNKHEDHHASRRKPRHFKFSHVHPGAVIENMTPGGRHQLSPQQHKKLYHHMTTAVVDKKSNNCRQPIVTKANDIHLGKVFYQENKQRIFDDIDSDEEFRSSSSARSSSSNNDDDSRLFLKSYGNVCFLSEL